nr:MAG: DNA pilot protein [Microvirus sp.]
MPISVLAGQMLANGVNTATNQGLNLLNYNRQRRDALSDWQRDANFNDPSQQIRRLQGANISPYAQSGQSLLATAPQTRGSQMSSTQNRPLDMMQMKQGMEQIKLLQLQQAKTEAETNSVKADVNNKTLDYTTNSQPYHTGGNVLGKKKLYELEQMLSNINNTNQSAQLRMEQSDSEVVKRHGYKVNNDIAEIEKIFRSDLLRGKTDLMRGQTQSLLLKNYRDEIENYYAGKNAGNNASILQSNAQIRKQEADLNNVLPSSVRYFLERMGGSNMASLLLRSLLKK